MPSGQETQGLGRFPGRHAHSVVVIVGEKDDRIDQPGDFVGDHWQSLRGVAPSGHVAAHPVAARQVQVIAIRVPTSNLDRLSHAQKDMLNGRLGA